MIEKSNSVKSYQGKEYYSGHLYDEQNFLQFRLAKTFLSHVSLADEYIEPIKKLAAEGVVVFALNQRSELNSLIIYELFKRKDMPIPVYCHGMNMSFWHPLPQMLKFFWSSFLRRFMREQKAWQGKLAYIEETIRHRKSIVIHLGESEFIENRAAESAILTLLDIQKKVDFPIFIVPVLVSYGRRREKEEENLINILFGQTEHTGALRRLITFIRYSRNAFVIPAEPVKLSEYINTIKSVSQEAIVHDLRGELIDRIEKEKTAIVGPVLKSREELIGMVLSDDSMEDFITDYAEKEKKNEIRIKKEARRYLYEIAADYSDTMIAIWKKVLSWLWNDIYDGLSIDMEGLTKIRNISKKMPFVIVPCHRSHIDYLLIHYIFYTNNIQLPFIAAGSNLSFFPMGYIFRKSGAFFMRRSFRGNKVYSEVFSKYLATLLKEGLPLEFFIEGGRSRTGKMVLPKYGLLSMVIQAYQEKYCENLAAIPVYIGYDRVIEEKSYLKELAGEDKTPDKAADIIKSSKVLTKRKRYGRVYVKIGEPMIMKDYLDALEKPIEQMSLEQRQSLYRKIGYEIVLEINKVSVVTPFSLVASVLLSHDRRGISHNELLDSLNEFYEYLSVKEVKFAETLANRDKAIMDALNMFVQSGFISKIEAEEDEEEEMLETVYSLKEEKRLSLEYYKNNILHFFVPLCFVATSIIKSNEDLISLSRILSDYAFLKKILWNEFIFDEHKDDAEEVNEVFAYLYDRKIVESTERDGQVFIEVKGKGSNKLKPFAGLIHNYLESFWIVVRSCLYLKKNQLTQKDWLKKIMTLGDRIYQKGEVLRQEALSQSNYLNVITFLEEKNLINAVRDEKSEKKEVSYALAENRAEMEVLRRRLFRFL
ncbi:MAG: 1-acyl-sn-glycerol-3-phosphate acyltransferase [Syntrophaceae bacterium]|nr:1-acyl-sn-glycerol-3-phosphate acyltransferase [Syntrophaceae bacterium]